MIVISAIADTRKSAGNDAFRKDDFVKAVNLYTEGIEVKCKDEDLNAKLYNNRASAHYHLGKVSFVLTLRIVTKLHFIHFIPTLRCFFLYTMTEYFFVQALQSSSCPIDVVKVK